MKLASWNVNGIRACQKKGLETFINNENIDFTFIQETKANLSQVTINDFQLDIHHAKKPGYSGVGILSKHNFTAKHGLDSEFDEEGRIIQTEINGIKIYNIYFPSGSSGAIRQEYKYKFLDFIYKYFQNINLDNTIICGDLNICHHDMDIHHPKQATRLELSGFLKPERDWVTNFLNLGFIDAFRYLNPLEQSYTWWTYRQNAREKNLGWRIDYFLVSKNLEKQIKTCKHLNNYSGSDHCPVLLEII